MASSKMKYIINSNTKYLYTLKESVTVDLSHLFSETFTHKYFNMNNGVLTINSEYSWDGATLFPDVPEIIKPSLIHDCLYQAIELKYLSCKTKFKADKVIFQLCITEGMSKLMAFIVFIGVLMGGNPCKPPVPPLNIK